MMGIGGVGAGGGIGAGLAVGGATTIMAGMPGMGALAAGGTEAGATSGMQASEVAAGGDKSPLQEFAKKLDDIFTAALLLELMDKKEEDKSSGMADALVAAAAVSLYKQMQSLDSAGASAAVAGVTISIVA